MSGIMPKRCFAPLFGVLLLILLLLVFSGDYTSPLLKLPPLALAETMLVALGIGIWSVQLGGRALWVLPLVCTFAMAAGSLIQPSSVVLMLAKAIILLSVFIVGMLVAGNVKMSTHVAAALVGILAFTHGYAYGHANFGLWRWQQPIAVTDLLVILLPALAAAVLMSLLGEATCNTLVKTHHKPIAYGIGALMLLAGLTMVVLE